MNRLHQIQMTLVYSVLSLLILLHLGIVLLNHYYFKTYAFDYGVYNFAFADFAHGHFGACPIYMHSQPISFLQDHFSLTLLILSPLYWLFSPLFGTYSLLIIQWLMIMYGAWATYKLIYNKSENKLFASFSLIYYLILYGRFSSYQADCNLVIMGSALVPVFIYYFEKQKLFPALLCFIFLIGNREDFALGLFFLCITWTILHFKNKTKRNQAFVFAILSLLIFIIIFGLLIPSLEDENKKFSLFNFEALGSNPIEAFGYILGHPIQTFSLFFVNHSMDPANDFIKLTFYLVYGISGGFVLFFRPVYFMAFIPLIAKKMFNDESFRWGHEGYNGVEVATLLPLCVFSIIHELKWEKVKRFIIVVVIVCSLGVSIYFMLHMSPLYYGFNKYDPLQSSLYTTDYDSRHLNLVLKEIPDTASVCASGRVLPHLAFRKKIYHFPNIKDANYICVYKAGSTFPISKEEFDRTCDSLKVNENWKILFEEGQCLLLKRN